jgi:citrate synthase
MGFGHRVYKNFDPRATLIKNAADKVLASSASTIRCSRSPSSSRRSRSATSYFIEHKLYPNVDFYSGIIYKALGIPVNMFTVMFTIGRLPGWMAHWIEMRNDPDTRIARPRQIIYGEDPSGARTRQWPGVIRNQTASRA